MNNFTLNYHFSIYKLYYFSIMDRRQALEQTAKILGISYLAPGIFIALQSCESNNNKDGWQPVALSQQQVDILIATADTILPETNSPSASEVKVHEFIDLIIKDVLTEEQGSNIILALSDIEESSKAKTGKSISKLDDEQKASVIQAIDDAAYGVKSQEKTSTHYKYLKTFILLSYYSSEQGVKQNLDYLPIPGEYQPCVDISTNPTIIVGDHL